jgi:hypothetical protein
LDDKHNKQVEPDLESLARECFDNLTAAEFELVRAASKGELAVCGVSDDLSDPTNDPNRANEWGNERQVRADLLAWLCLDRRASGLVHPKGIKLIGAKIADEIDLSFITIGFPLVLAQCRLFRGLNLFGARARTISLQGSRVHSVLGDGAVINGAVLLRDGFVSENGVRLTGAKIDGPFDCSGSIFEATGPGPALVADGIVVAGPVFLRGGFRATGEVRFPHAQIGTDFDCSQGIFRSTASSGTNQSNCALNAEGVVVGGSVFLKNGFRADGLVLLHGSQIEFNLDCVGGHFLNSSSQGGQDIRTVLNFDSSVVKSSAMLQDGFHAEGLVSMIATQIGGNLACRNSNFGIGLFAERAVVKGTLFWRGIQNAATVNLNLIGASADSVSDDTNSWPPKGNLQLHGFQYQRFSASSPRAVLERLDWLARLKSFTPQPYRQLANVLGDEDDDVGARRVLYEMAGIRSQENQDNFARGWNFILKYAIGYGYYPSRALLCLLCLAVLGFGLYCGGYYAGSVVPTEKDTYILFKSNHRIPDYYEPFHASIFSLENSFPLVKLGQVDHWKIDPSPDNSARFAVWRLGFSIRILNLTRLLRAFSWAQIVLGWLFATMGIAAVTGLVRRD